MIPFFNALFLQFLTPWKLCSTRPQLLCSSWICRIRTWSTDWCAAKIWTAINASTNSFRQKFMAGSKLVSFFSFLFFSFNFTLKSNKFSLLPNLIIRHAPIQTESPSLDTTRKGQTKWCERCKTRSQTPFHEPCWQVNLAYIFTFHPDFFS